MKKILISSLAITGVSSIGFASFFGVYYSKYSSLDKATKNLWGNKKIHIVAFNKQGTQTFNKIYISSTKEKTLEDLMLTHTDDFKLSAPGQYGRMVESIGQLEALFKNGSWWQIASETYLKSNPYNKSVGQKTQTSKPYSLNVGISRIYLARNETFKFYETAA